MYLYVLINYVFFFLKNEKNSGFSVKSLQPQHEVSIIQLITIYFCRFIYSFFPISATCVFCNRSCFCFRIGPEQIE